MKRTILYCVFVLINMVLFIQSSQSDPAVPVPPYGTYNGSCDPCSIDNTNTSWSCLCKNADSSKQITNTISVAAAYKCNITENGTYDNDNGFLICNVPK